MEFTGDFTGFRDKVISSLRNVTKAAGQLAAADLSFHRSSSGALSSNLDSQNKRLLQLTNRLLRAATADSTNEPPRLSDAEDVDDNWRSIVDTIDDLLEKADACLDEYTGVIKRLSPSLQHDAAISTNTKENSKKRPPIFSTSIIAKPQLLFDSPVANHTTTPFKPILRFKPHALRSLEESIGSGDLPGYMHPYGTEIEQSSYPPPTYISSSPIPYTPPSDSHPSFVDTEGGVRDMLAELKSAKEIAIDLEHHDAHSYFGLVSLMQISTREKDWIVDTLKPWRENLQILNEVFADPNILKVFHGSNMDMIWLQRDLGLYVVGLFDTYHACIALSLPARSLKYLLDRFAEFKAQKIYQTADWRVRPIPPEMLDYARSDTHYLLYIYDNLRNMLLEATTKTNNLVDYVLEESKNEALQRYERPVYDSEHGLGANGWYNQLVRRSNRLSNEQFGVYRAVHEWRDRLARELDEGVSSILTVAGVFVIAEAMPTSVPGLMGALRPISKAVIDNARALVEVIKKGKDLGRDGPSVSVVIKDNEEVLGQRPHPSVLAKKRSRNHSRTQTNDGIGATVQMLTKTGDVHSQTDLAPVATRSTDSRLWGAAILTRPVVSPATPVAADLASVALRTVLPLPVDLKLSFTDTAFETHPDPDATLANAATIIRNGNIENGEKRKGIAAIVDVGIRTKRKADEELNSTSASISTPTSTSTPAGVGGTSVSSVDLSPVPGDSASSRKTEADSRAQRKESRRAERKQNKWRKISCSNADGPEEAVVPYDYAKAESLLTAKAGKQDNKSRRANRLFNPYAKALDTPTGLQRARKEESGKSFTFKK